MFLIFYSRPGKLVNIFVMFLVFLVMFLGLHLGHVFDNIPCSGLGLSLVHDPSPDFGPGPEPRLSPGPSPGPGSAPFPFLVLGLVHILKFFSRFIF